MKGSIVLLLVVFFMPATAEAEDYREPSRRWFSGVFRGEVYAAVRNNHGAELRFNCPTLASGGGMPWVRLEASHCVSNRNDGTVNAVFEVDGRPIEWSFERSSKDDEVYPYSIKAFNLHTSAQLSSLASELRRGNEVVLFIPADRVMERFTLDGSAEALAGC